MNASAGVAAVQREAQALVSALQAAESRLREITGGQVDAITGADGRTFLLQNAQDSVRHDDAQRREAILNCLPANIALLDAEGLIVSVNESWRRFGASNGVRGTSAGVGADYLKVCRQAHGDHAEEAAMVASGLASVLSGQSASFGAEYPCHSPDEKRWFEMTVTPLSGLRLDGVVVMHLDVTARKLHEIALQSSEERQREANRQLALERSRLLAAQAVAGMGSWEADLASMHILWSPETYRIHERVDDGTPVTHAQFLAGVHPDDRAQVDLALTATQAAGAPALLRHRLLFPDGRIKYIEKRWQVDRDQQGRPLRTAGTCQDITETRLAELQIERISRGYQLLSQINSLIVRVRDRDELFRDACRIAVDRGGFEIAWIGAVDAAGEAIIPIGSAGGDEEFMREVGQRLPLATGTGTDPVAQAVHDRAIVVVDDMATDARILRPQMHAALGIGSMVAVPALVGGEVVAVLALYARGGGGFDHAELRLLQELANNIAFAVDHIGKAETIDYLAYFDPLTGMANRTLFLERASQSLLGVVGEGQAAAMVLMDLERFKNINDSLGMHAGDALLKQVAAWLAAEVGASGLLGRVGADRFALLLTDDAPGDAVRRLDRLVTAFHDETFLLDGVPFLIAAKFGVAMYPEDAATATTLFQKSESALKNAKASGRRQMFYTQPMTDSIARKLAQENQLRHALDQGEFTLHYQPKINVASGKVVSAEALLRWNDPLTGTLVPAAQFVPILEETGLIVDVGRWAIRQAIDDHLRWQREGLPAVRLAVNVAAVQLRDPCFVEDVRRLLSVDALAPGGLELEITESMLMDDIEQSILTLDGLRAMGLRIAIDDFGTGFSSLAYLSRLPVDSLKIDRSFVNEMGASPKGLALVSTMISIARSFDLTVVAEGVETEDQASLLKLLRCDEAQGYLFGRPMPCADFETFLLARAGAPGAVTRTP